MVHMLKSSINFSLNQGETRAPPSNNVLLGISALGSAYQFKIGSRNDEIRMEIETGFGYDLKRSSDKIRPNY